MFIMIKSFPLERVFVLLWFDFGGAAEGLKHRQCIFPVNNVLPELFVKKKLKSN